MAKSSMDKSKKLVFIIDIAILVIVAIALAVSMKWSQDIELKLGLLYYEDINNVDESDIVVLDKNSGGIRVSADGVEDITSEGDGGVIPEDSASMYVHYVDVGQGDCAVIELPDNKTILIDGGENNKTVESAIKTFIDNTFDSSFKYFDYAILTHADSDHCGSFDYVLNNYPARVVYRPNVEAVGTKSSPYTDQGKSDLTADAVTKDTAVYANAVKAMYQTTSDFTSKVYVTDPEAEEQTISGGEGDDKYSLTFYTPLSTKYTGEGDWNNYSPIMILEYRGFKFAMSGDAEEKNLGEFVTRVANAKTDGVTDKYDVFDENYCVNVIKAGHHGSRNATTLDYLNAITSPSGAPNVYCVISCGKDNKYKHPHQEALDRYSAIGVRDENVLRTDVSGDITFSVHIDEHTGEYNLFYGDKATKPIDPTEPIITVLTYRTLGSIKLKWAVVAWTCYAVLVVIAAVHIVYTAMHSDGTNSSGNKSSNKPKSGNRR